MGKDETIGNVVTENQTPPETSGQEADNSGQHVYSREEILNALRDNPDLLSEDDTFSIPAVRSRIDRVISKKDTEFREKYEREQQEKADRVNLIRNARNYVQAISGASADQLRIWGQQDPELWAKFAQAQELLKDPDNQIATRTANSIFKGIMDDLHQDMPDEDFSEATNVVELLNLAKEKKMAKGMDELAKLLDDKLEAFRKEFRGEKVRQEDQPEVNPTSGNKYTPDSFEAIEMGYVNGTVSREQYSAALSKRGKT